MQEGCLEAAKPSISIANNTFGITMKDSSMVQLRSIASSKASCNALSNSSLSWDQIYFTGKVLVRVIKKEGWPLIHANLMVDFFCRLDYERSNLGHDVDNTLIEYHVRNCCSSMTYLHSLYAIYTALMLCALPLAVYTAFCCAHSLWLCSYLYIYH